MARIDINEKLLEDVIESLDKRITRLISRLDVDNNNRLLSDAIDLKRARSMRKSIAREFGKYNDAARLSSDFTPVGKELTKIFKDIGISDAITRTDKTILRNLSQDSFLQMQALGEQYSNSVASKIYASVLSGDSIDDLIEEVSQLLVGGTDKLGRPLKAHAKTIATTGYREADSILLKKKSEEFEINKFKYSGSLIKDSRKWCVDHVNKTYTMEEIEKWESRQWKGKKSGDPFVARGGWNCRHRWLPVLND